MIKEHPIFVLLCIVSLFVMGSTVYERGFNAGVYEASIAEETYQAGCAQAFNAMEHAVIEVQCTDTYNLLKRQLL